MTAQAWLAEFERRERAWFAARDARWAAIAARAAPVEHVAPALPLVFVSREVEVDDDAVKDGARKIARAGEAAGWTVRLVAAVALSPVEGGAKDPKLMATVTVRLRRHDERIWAAWLNGAFDCAWYVGPDGLERLGGTRLAGLLSAAKTRAAKSGKPLVAPSVRGILDVIEGVRGPVQWARHFEALDALEINRAAGVLRAAGLDLELVAA